MYVLNLYVLCLLKQNNEPPHPCSQQGISQFSALIESSLVDPPSGRIANLLHFFVMTSAIDKNCTFLISNDKSGSVTQEEICKDLESSEVESKVRYFHQCHLFNDFSTLVNFVLFLL